MTIVNNEAYRTLHAIRRGHREKLEGRECWIEALIAVRWVEKKPRRMVLTTAGREALQAMAHTQQRSSQIDPWGRARAEFRKRGRSDQSEQAS